MRGRPLIEWLCFAVVWLALLLPLLRVTGSGNSRPVVQRKSVAEAPVAAIDAWLRVSFSEPPAFFSLSSGGTVIWEETDVEEDMEQLVAVVLDGEDPSIELDIRWDAGGRRAIGLVLEPLEGSAREIFLWRDASVVREKVVFR